MFTSLSKRLNQKNALLAVVGLLLLVIFVPNVTYANLLESFLWRLVNMVFGWLVWASGSLLDYSINYMVVGFGDMYATNGLGLTIDTLWVTVRDIFNLTFIFGLVFIGLRMIFGSSSDAKKMLVQIIMAALLVNFSLFITKFVVDFSNIAAVQIVNSFPIDDTTGLPSISGDFARLMGLTSLLDFSTSAGADFSKFTGGGAIGYIFGTMFLYIITAFVFFAGSFLLIIRFVVLNIYMVLSPFMFIGWVFPSMAKYTSEYWSGFLSRCFVAPAYILMIYFSAKVLASFSITGGGRNSLSTMWTDFAPASFSAVFPPFVLTAVFLIASVVVAQKMSATGGSAVISLQDKMMKKTKSMVGTAAFAPAARLSQKTVGYGANKLSNNKTLNSWAANSKVMKGALVTSRKVADSSFDARNIMGMGAATGYGAGATKGYATREKERKEADLKFAKSLSETKIKDGNGNYLPTGKTKPDGTAETMQDVVKAKHNEIVANEGADSTSKLSKARAEYAAVNAAKNAADAALVAKRAEIDAAQKPINDEVKTLEAELAALPTDKLDPAFNPLRKKQIEDSITAKKASLAPIVNRYAADLQALNAAAESAKKDLSAKKVAEDKILTQLEADAEAAIKFQNQLAFIASRQKDVAMFDNVADKMIKGGTVIGTVVGGSQGGAIGAGIGAVVGGGVGGVLKAVSSSYRDTAQTSVDNLKKSYGTYGKAMLDAEAKKKNAELLKEIIKDNTDADKPAAAPKDPAATT